VLAAQLLDTDRIEIAPGSDVVEEDLEVSHGFIVADTVWKAIGEQARKGASGSARELLADGGGAGEEEQKQAGQCCGATGHG
jgi:hypothetical protein